MTTLIPAIKRMRSSVAAVMIITPDAKNSHVGQKQEFKISFGTAWCVARGEYFLTAFHVLNDGKPRNASSKLHLFLVPDNQRLAFHSPAEVVLEDPANDLAILRVKPGAFGNECEIKSIPITFDAVEDSTEVLTCGFRLPALRMQISPMTASCVVAQCS